jgi:CubicO group peptidase (beta-lactamase class C family)
VPRLAVLLLVLSVTFGAIAAAAPDEIKLGKAQGYPVGTPATWFFDESVRVGSFTHEADIKGLYRGQVNVLPASTRPMPLPMAPQEPQFHWNARDARNRTLDDYLARQRIMGLIIVKDGIVQVERYQYDRKPTDRFTSQSMAKSLVSLAVGIAQREGFIKSLDDTAAQYAPGIKGTLLGDTTLRNLLRMASGMKYEETYDGLGDGARFSKAMVADGFAAAIRQITVRDVDPGTRFNYAGPQTLALAAALRGATHMNLSAYLTPRLWQAIGAADSASWYADRTGLEVASANFNATLRDYARLGVVLAYDGVRPDDPTATHIIPLDYLLDATDWKRVPQAFRPGKATSYQGYGYQFWLFPGEQRRFAMLGVFGQSVYVDPGLKLVMVQTAANATPEAYKTSLAQDRDAFWRGVVAFYGRW